MASLKSNTDEQIYLLTGIHVIYTAKQIKKKSKSDKLFR